MTGKPEASSPFPWPPAVFGGAFALAALATWLAPALIASAGAAAWLRWAGAIVIGAGVVIALAAEIGFFRAGTATLPHRPTSAIVVTGVYRVSRNPMYLGMALFLAGAGLFANSWWFPAALPFAVYAVTKLAIEREEAYLERKFGAEYQAYKARVRRWL